MAKKLKLTLVAFSLMTLSACSLTYPVGIVTKTE